MTNISLLNPGGVVAGDELGYNNLNPNNADSAKIYDNILSGEVSPEHVWMWQRKENKEKSFTDT